MKRIRSMKGLEIYKTNDGVERVGVIYYYNGKPLREMVEAVGEPDPALRGDVTAIKYRKRLDGRYKDSRACVEAVKVLDTRRAEVAKAKADRVPYLPPKERAAEAERQRIESAKVAEDARTPLLFDDAVKRFMLARTYARQKSVKGYFRNLGKAFAGRHLDTITKAEVAQYYRDRRQNTGPFLDWPHKGGIRPAEIDVMHFSALYTFLIEVEERAIPKNPCKGHQASGGRTKAETYTPERTPYTASDAEVSAIFDAASREKMPRFASHLPGDPLRAFLKLCHYTGGRTESEPCALRHGDVTFSDPNVVSTSGRKAMGQIRIRKAKNAKSNRDLPMHPDLEGDLKSVMLERPEDPAKVDAWAALPIFRQEDTKKAWTTSSYKKGWAAIVAKLAKPHPGLGGMVVRDFRDLARTKLTDARIPEPVIRRWMGHAGDVSQRYYQVTTRAMEEAADALTLTANRISDRISDKPGTVVEVARAANS